MAQEIPEGTIADGPNGPLVRRNGRWVAASQGTFTPDPAARYEAPAAAADLENTRSTIEARNRQAAIDERRLALDEVAAREEAAAREADTPARRAEIADRASRLDALAQQINRTQQLFDSGPGSTTGLRSLADYLPTGENARFDTAGASLAQQGLAAFRVPGTGTVSDRDAMMFDRANLPTASMRDDAVDEQLRGLRARVDEERAALGIAPFQWRQTTLPRFQPEQEQEAQTAPPQGAQGGGIPPAVWDNIYGGRAPSLEAAPAFSSTQAVPMRQEMQDAHANLVNRLLAQGGGRMDPAAYAQGRAALDQQFNRQSDGQANQDWATSINNYLDSGGQTVPLDISPDQEEMSILDRVRHDFLMRGDGAFLAAVGDAGGAGLVSMLAPEQMAALRNARPGATLAGDIAGSIGGTAGIGALGRNTIGRALPSLMAEGGARRFGRNLATDVAYSGLYSANTGGNVPLDMLLGGIGSSAGQLTAEVAGGIAAGARPSAQAQYLQGRNIPLTTGQTLGGFPRRVEERMASIPIAGDMVAARMGEGAEALHREMLTEAGRPIGFAPTRVGREGAGDLMGDVALGRRGAINDAFDSATQGRSFASDPELMQDINAAAGQAQRLPPELAQNADLALRNTFDPIARNGAVTGPEWQGMRSDLRGFGAAQTGPGFPANYRGIMDDAVTALDDMAGRQGGPQVVTDLNNANTAYRLGNIVNDATYRADGANYLPTASQLQDAIKASSRRFPGLNPLAELADNAQAVMPNRIPNSGTADRLFQASVLTGGLGGGAGYISGGDAQSGAAGGAALPTIAALLLAMGGTKGGQRLITGAITRRPEQVRRAGEQIRRRAGLFGTAAAAPMVIGQQ